MQSPVEGAAAPPRPTWRARETPFGLAPVVGAGASLAALGVAVSKYGIGLTPDSTAYLAAAESFVEGDGLALYDGRPFVDWPPLYSVVIAGTMRLLPTDSASAALVVNAAALAATIAGAWLLFSAAVGRYGRDAVLLPTAFVAVAPPLLRITVMAWSEILFVLLVVAFLHAVVRHLDRGGHGGFRAAAGLASLAALDRYVGVTLIAVGAGAAATAAPAGAKLRRAGVFAAIASGPLVLWMGRNVAVAGHVLGARKPGSTPIIESVEHSATTVSAWFAPGVEAAWPALLPGAAALAGLTARSQAVRVSAAFAWTYWICILAASSASSIDRIDDRLLAPLFVPLVVTAAFFVADGVSRLSEGPQRAARVALAVWIGLVGFHLVADVRLRAALGVGGYSQMTWRETPIARAVGGGMLGEDAVVFSNAPDLCWILGVEAPQFAPWRGREPESTASAWASRKLPPSGAFLVWFDRIRRPYLLTPREIASAAEVRVAARFPTGTVYRLGSKGPDSPKRGTIGAGRGLNGKESSWTGPYSSKSPEPPLSAKAGSRISMPAPRAQEFRKPTGSGADFAGAQTAP